MAEVQAGPVAASQASSINLITREKAIATNAGVNRDGQSWRMILQGDGTAGYVNLEHVAMVLNGVNGEAILVWAVARWLRNEQGEAVAEYEISAPGMTCAEVLGIVDPATQ